MAVTTVVVYKQIILFSFYNRIRMSKHRLFLVSDQVVKEVATWSLVIRSAKYALLRAAKKNSEQPTSLIFPVCTCHVFFCRLLLHMHFDCEVRGRGSAEGTGFGVKSGLLAGEKVVFAALFACFGLPIIACANFCRQVCAWSQSRDVLP